ncbi:disulfide isomerase [Trichodelitschia bisporula]|uniref:protein disulfide-isomerase n=1 Tax=Trichodelitschia bisporula TaxID=703511 RepID=A0A6G1I9U1_9PEZI|nr:disulfide isomerase [Trichodelitschia bisporula]
MTRISTLLVAFSAAWVAAAGSAVIDLIPSNFDDIVLKSGKPALVEFFAPWCGHCKTLAPIYEELAQKFQFAEDKVVIAKVDADEHKDLGRRFGVQGFPTLKWFDGKSKDPVDYKSGRDLDSLSAFISEKTGIKARTAPKPPSNVVMLSDQSFKTLIGGDKNVLVAFTAPWCGHCKTLAPIWEALATTFKLEPNVVIAKVDAEAPESKQTAQDQGVTGYPTIMYFPAGSKEPKAYGGGRVETAFVEFLNENAGTHRVAGGGLTAAAGTIATLDALVQKALGAGKDLGSIADDLVAAAKKEADPLAAYYGRVAGKVKSNAGYVKKELGRLEGILKKGGLAPEKVDELTKRANVLRKFVVDVAVGDEEKSEL